MSTLVSLLQSADREKKTCELQFFANGRLIKMLNFKMILCIMALVMVCVRMSISILLFCYIFISCHLFEIHSFLVCQYLVSNTVVLTHIGHPVNAIKTIN